MESVTIDGLIDALRADEGDSVTILCENPDGPPNSAVECNGYWTGWRDLRFEGETLLDALANAYLTQIQYKSAIAHGIEKPFDTSRPEKREPSSPQQGEMDQSGGVEYWKQIAREDRQRVVQLEAELKALLSASPQQGEEPIK